MGKIFDALEKSKEKHKSSGALDKTLDTDISAKVDNPPYPP